MNTVTSRVDLYQSVKQPDSFCAILRWNSEELIPDECFFDIQRMADEHAFTFENFCSLLFSYPYYKLEDHGHGLGLRAMLIDSLTDPKSFPDEWVLIAEATPEYIRTIRGVPVQSVEDPVLSVVVKKQDISPDAYFFIYGEYPES